MDEHRASFVDRAAPVAAPSPEQLMCLPVLLDQLGPEILRTHMSTASCKPIPNNERVDLARFHAREPQVALE